jgi:NADP-dependent 3-hydroxy acid dehydrogenase YdfG
MEPEDVAEAIVFAVTRHPRVQVNEILIRPTEEE